MTKKKPDNKKASKRAEEAPDERKPLVLRPPETPLKEAQEVMYDAFEAYGRKRVKLARKALSISEDCADAYTLLAEEAARSAEEALELYEKALRAAERTLDARHFTEYAGHFWSILQTRPYMRARAGLATTLWTLGRSDEAIEHLQDLLRLNPNDNQGLRYFLATALLSTGRHDELSRLLEEYAEGTAYWAYTEALLEFKLQGSTKGSTQTLQAALGANAFIPDYLLGRKKLPRLMPEFVSFGDESEALDYVARNLEIWQETPGALPWLAEQVGDDDFSEAAGTDDEWFGDAFFDDLEDGYFLFELDAWLEGLNIPRKEHKFIQACLRRGAGAYSKAFYGRDRYKRADQETIDEELEVPFVFGYAATEILNHGKISDETKAKVVEFALLITQPTAFQGIPYGLLEMLGYLAQQQQLLITHLVLALLGLETNERLTLGPSYWTDGVTSPAMAAIADWIAGSEELGDGEKLWFAWKVTVQCDSAAHLGKAFANTFFDHPAVPDAVKRQLCWSWLDDNREVGAPHYTWLLMQAYMAGDLQEIERIKETYQLDLEDMPLPDPDDGPQVLQDAFRDEVHTHRQRMMSPYLKRLAIPMLVRLGEDLQEMVDRFWGHENDYFDPIVKTGVGDAIVAFHDRLEAEELRSLIERGVYDTSAKVRKPFYLFSTNFYGDQYLREALDDNAASIRRWAAKKLEKNK